MTEAKIMHRQTQSLLEVIHFIEEASSKIYGIMDEAEIYRTVTKAFAKSKQYNIAIMLLTEDGTKLKYREISIDN